MREDVSMSDKAQGNLLVTFQFILLAIILFFPKGNMWILTAELGWVALALTFGGLFLAVFGIFKLGSSLTAHPSPKNAGQLMTTGVYSRIRHPIYSGLAVMCLGVTMSSRSLVVAVCLVLLYALFAYKARFEERLLLAHYKEYASYASHTGRFIPGVGKIRS